MPMETEILSQNDNALLHRKEALIRIRHTGKATPKRADCPQHLAKALETPPELLIVDKIFTSSGEAASTAKVLAYKKAEDIPKHKLVKMEKRIHGVKAEAKAEKPKEGE